MRLVDISLDQLQEAAWNPNQMDEITIARLRESISRYTLLQNLVVRPLRHDAYEVLSGNQRLQVLREIGFEDVPCVVVNLDDADARLLAQALNHVHGEDDLGLRAEALREILKQIPEEQVLAVLPETSNGLNALSTLGQQDMAEHLRAWQQAQAARLKHLQFQLTSSQLEVVQRALASVMSRAKDSLEENPNARGTALYLLCMAFLEREDAS